MDCTQFDDLAELLAAGELDAAATAEANAHAAACPTCRARAAAARAGIAALEAALAPHRAAESFTARAMSRVRAAAPREAAETGPEPLRSRLFRYAALAAAAALFVAAGYGFIQRSRTAWVEGGTVAVLGPDARTLRPNSSLAVGDLLATPANSAATLALAGGRLRVALAPGSVARVTDPRTGTALQLLRGEMSCRGSDGENTPMVASPLANVAAGPGLISLAVTPQATAKSAAPGAAPFEGVVTLAAHDGAARVVVPGRTAGPVPLDRGQVLTLSSDPRRSFSVPVPIERVRQSLESERRGLMARHADLQLHWQAIAAGLRGGTMAEPGQLVRYAGDVQDALGQTGAMHAELERRMQLLDRWQAEGRSNLRLIVQPAAPRP
ncbi:MAG TPA: hypothetical protein PLE19_02660 [Planctomycetota bacterium]|nr:hypothetical protein [Planctomycetota bacterium]HRR79993.1 hypothetical protein [Planctomycetota bacterium]HRT94578.1 hypothetical protein [Planctomycetota bacterium]